MQCDAYLVACAVQLQRPPERLALIGELWDSLGGAQLQLSEAQTSELDRRLERFDQDRPDAVGWTELKAELAAREL